AEVPNVALVVLPVPIQRVLREDAGLEDLVTDLDRLYAVECPRVVRDGHDVDDRRLVDGSLVREPRSRNHREIRIVDRRRLAEVARAEAWTGRRRPGARAVRCQRVRQWSQHDQTQDRPTKDQRSTDASHLSSLLSSRDAARVTL